METSSEFVMRLSKSVPCYYHSRKGSDGISLTKYNSLVHGKMGQFATVYDRPAKGVFEIIAKECLADGWCKAAANKRSARSFGNDPNNPKHAGLVYYVEKDSVSKDYQNASRALRIIADNLKL